MALQDDMMQLVSNGGLFTKPFQSEIANFKSKMASMVTNPQVPLNRVAEVTSVVGTMNDSLSALDTHFDSILNPTAFASIATTMSAINNVSNLDSCSRYLSAFAELIDTEKIAQILALLALIDSLTSQNLDDILDRIRSLATKMLTDVQNAARMFLDSQLELLRLSVANNLLSLIGNECLRDIIGAVGTPQLQQITQAVRNKAQETITEAIQI